MLENVEISTFFIKKRGFNFRFAASYNRKNAVKYWKFFHVFLMYFAHKTQYTFSYYKVLTL